MGVVTMWLSEAVRRTRQKPGASKHSGIELGAMAYGAYRSELAMRATDDRPVMFRGVRVNLNAMLAQDEMHVWEKRRHARGKITRQHDPEITLEDLPEEAEEAAAAAAAPEASEEPGEPIVQESATESP